MNPNAISLVLCLIFTLTLWLGQAASQQPASQAPKRPVAAKAGPELSSVIVDLQKGKEDFEKYMGHTLEPQLTRIGDMFERNVDRAEKLLSELQKDPGNEQLHAQYEDCLSEGITEAVAYLGEFSQLEEPTFAALDGVSRTIAEAQMAFEADAAMGRIQVVENQARVAALRGRLTELAGQYKDNIEQGKSLPAEVEMDIRMGDVDLQTAIAMAKIDQLAVAQAKQSLADLKAQLQDLAGLRGELQVAFRQGEGQQALLVKVADLKRKRLQAQAVGKRLLAVRRVISERKTDLKRLGDLVTRIVDRGINVGPAGEKKTLAAAKAQPGLDILRAYLPEGQEQKGQPNVASK